MHRNLSAVLQSGLDGQHFIGLGEILVATCAQSYQKCLAWLANPLFADPLFDALEHVAIFSSAKPSNRRQISFRGKTYDFSHTFLNIPVLVSQDFATFELLGTRGLTWEIRFDFVRAKNG